MDKEAQVEVLNDLIAKNYDAEKGYKEAAEDAESPQLKSLFNDNAKQRYDFGHEIKDEIRKLGGEIEKGDTLLAKIHRAWIDLKTLVSGQDDKAVLEEVKRGEENALEHYQDALDKLPVDSSAYAVVVNQRNRIRSVISRVEQLIPVYDK